jgi:hypothetical protein
VLRFIMAFLVCRRLSSMAGTRVSLSACKMRGMADDFNDRRVKSMADPGDGASFKLSHRYGSR